MNSEIELEFFKRFIAKNRRDRFVWNLRRHKIFDDLRDTRHFDDKKLSEVDEPKDVVKFLESNRVAKDIYIISSDEDRDGYTVSIDELSNPDFWSPEEILGYCPTRKVGFFRNHEYWHFLLK